MTPFGILPFQEYGKPALAVGIEGEALCHLPLLTPDVATIVTRTQAHIDLDGAVLGPLHRTTLAASEPTACFAGTHIEATGFTYRSHWSMRGQVVRVHREFRS